MKSQARCTSFTTNFNISMADFSFTEVFGWWTLPGHMVIVCELRESSSFNPLALLSQRASLLATWLEEKDYRWKNTQAILWADLKGWTSLLFIFYWQNSVILTYSDTKKAGKYHSSCLGGKWNIYITVSSILLTLKLSTLCPQNCLTCSNST